MNLQAGVPILCGFGGGNGGGGGSGGGGGYLFNHKALAKVFRGKLLDAIEAAGLTLPAAVPATWVVDCKAVGDGQQALLYLGRYLYRGVIQERDILRCDNQGDGNVTFQYRDAKTGRMARRTLPGADFLWLVLQHVLPKGLRPTRRTSPPRAPPAPSGAAPAASRWPCCVGACRRRYNVSPAPPHGHGDLTRPARPTGPDSANPTDPITRETQRCTDRCSTAGVVYGLHQSAVAPACPPP